MKELIYTCGCGDTDRFAKDAFKLLFPTEKMPTISHNLGIINDSDLRKVINGLAKNTQKYAYYILQIDGRISVWDLLEGVQIL